MAEHIYHCDQYSNKEDRTIAGWRLIDVWYGRESMKMGIYIREGDDWQNPSEYVLVFKGSSDVQNWENNTEGENNEKSVYENRYCLRHSYFIGCNVVYVSNYRSVLNFYV